jgi:hypothetical protein
VRREFDQLICVAGDHRLDAHRSVTTSQVLQTVSCERLVK